MSEEEKIAEVVRKYGWYACSVYDGEPPFLYSVGLMQSYDHPEFIIFGLESKEAHAILTVTIEAIRAGASFRESGVHSGILEGDACVWIRRAASIGRNTSILATPWATAGTSDGQGSWRPFRCSGPTRMASFRSMLAAICMSGRASRGSTCRCPHRRSGNSGVNGNNDTPQIFGTPRASRTLPMPMRTWA